MPFLVLGFLIFVSGLFLMRIGKKEGSKEFFYGSFGLVIGGLVLFFSFLALILTQNL